MNIYLTKMNSSESIDITKFKNLELLGFCYFIKSLDINQSVDLNTISSTYNTNTKEIKKMLNQLEKNKIISVNIREAQDIFVEIKFLELKEEKVSIYNFNIASEQFSSLLEIGDNPEIRNLKIVKYLMDNFNPPKTLLKYQINSKEDFLNYISEVDPLLLVYNFNQSLTKDAVAVLVKCAVEYNFSKQIINILVDYTINSNTFKSFNPKFAEKVAFSWFKNNLSEVDAVLDFIKEVKIQNNSVKNGTKYNEPVFEVIDETNIEVLNENELAELLNKVYE